MNPNIPDTKYHDHPNVADRLAAVQRLIGDLNQRILNGQRGLQQMLRVAEKHRDLYQAERDAEMGIGLPRLIQTRTAD